MRPENDYQKPVPYEAPRGPLWLTSEYTGCRAEAKLWSVSKGGGLGQELGLAKTRKRGAGKQRRWLEELQNKG